jgi:hypothetical protein
VVPESKLVYLTAIIAMLISAMANIYPFFASSAYATLNSNNSQLISLGDILKQMGQDNNMTLAAPSQLKNYSDDAFDFTIQYPERWFPTTYGAGHYSDLISFYAPLKNITDMFPPKVTISALKIADSISLAEYTNITLNVFNSSDQRVINGSEPTTLSGYPAHAVLLGSIDPDFGNITYYTVNIWTVHNNNVYALTYEGSASKVKSYLGDFITMLHSLRIGTDGKSEIDWGKGPVPGMRPRL